MIPLRREKTRSYNVKTPTRSLSKKENEEKYFDQSEIQTALLLIPNLIPSDIVV